jgi:hypothetical protein
MANDKPSWVRQLFAASLGLLTVMAGLSVWYGLKLWTLKSYPEANIMFMPLLIGAAVGWVMRTQMAAGTFRLASFAFLLALLGGWLVALFNIGWILRSGCNDILTWPIAKSSV